MIIIKIRQSHVCLWDRYIQSIDT